MRLVSSLGRSAALAGVALVASVGFAQAPPAPIPFVSWAPLGEYEQAAFAEEGSLRIVIPTKRRNVEIAFTPQQILDAGYAAERIDARGVRAGVAAPHVAAYTGHVERNSGRDFAKVSYSRERGVIEGLLRVDGAFYALGANVAAGAYLIDVREVTEDEVAALAQSCGVTAEELQLGAEAPTTAAATTAPPQTAAAGALREIDFGTEADAPFVSQTGGVAAANARIASIVNMMNGIYETDLGLTARISAQRAHAGSDPYTSTDAEALLDQFEAQFSRNVFTPYDSAMLFSGRNFDGSTVGLAYLDATCQPWRYGVSQFLNQSDFYTSLIVAHELGHNLGADHTSAGIMTPAISGETYFSQASRDEIAYYTSRVACLALAAGSGTNTAPTLTPIGPQQVNEGATLTIALQASDPDGDPLNYGATPLPNGATISPSGVFQFTPPRSAAGCNGSSQVMVQFAASDGLLGATETVPITIVDVQTNPAAPTLSDPADRSVYSGQRVQFQLQASDADGDTVTFSSSTLPSGATLSAGGAFGWTPSAAQVGSTPISFTATDCTGRSTTQSATINVSIQPAPHLASLSTTTGWYGQPLTLNGSALAGNQVVVTIAGKLASVMSVSDTQVSVIVPKAKKKKRRAGPQPVTLTRDGVAADVVLSFDYVKP